MAQSQQALSSKQQQNQIEIGVKKMLATFPSLRAIVLKIAGHARDSRGYKFCVFAGDRC